MTLNLRIITPYGLYFTGEVDYLSVDTELGILGVLPEHTPLITTLKISKLTIKKSDGEFVFAISGGVIDIKDEQTTVLARSIEAKSDIDVERALKAKKRAIERLQSGDKIDVKRAQAALARALNRLHVVGESKDY